MIGTARLASYELRRFKGPLPKVALGFLILVPLMYGALYLWSNWDPYGRLDQVPVAVVNEDTPTVVDGKTVDAGRQFVDQLDNDRIFDWHVTNGADAAAGLADGRYYLTITVPQDFSANLASGSGSDPRRAVLMLHRDDVNGYVIGLMTGTVQDKLAAAIDKAAIGTYFDAVFGNLEQIRTGLTDAATGSGSLATGLDTAKTGAGQLSDGLGTAKTGADQLKTGLDTAKTGSAALVSGLASAVTGADDLAGGLDTASTGASGLSTGLATLKTGSATLATGADQVAAGNRTIADQVVPVLNAVVPVLPQVTQAATDLTTAVADVTGLVSTGTDSLASRATAVTTAIDDLVAAHPDLAGDPAVVAMRAAAGAVSSRATEIATATSDVATAAQTVQGVATTIQQNVPTISAEITDAAAKIGQLADGAEQVASGAHQLDDGLATAATGAATLSAGLATADTGAHTLATGLGQLSTGAGQLDTGIGTLQTGAGQLSSGLQTAVTGAGDLVTGVGKLDDGAHQLAEQLTTGAGRVPALTDDQQRDAVQVLSEPADVRTTVDHPATVYGRGLAPFFFAIAIWVFGISVFLVLRPTTGRALAGRASAARIAIAGWAPVLALAVVGSIILLLVSWFALGLDPVHPLASTGVVLLAAVCFTAIAHLLRTALGTVGSAITLVLLMVQLTSAGGLYPVQTLPALLQAIHPFVPMTYLIDALRITFTGGPIPRLWLDVGVLAGFAAAAVGATVWVVTRRREFAFKDLHPILA